MRNEWLTEEMALAIVREYQSNASGTPLERARFALPHIPIIQRRYYDDDPIYEGIAEAKRCAQELRRAMGALREALDAFAPE